MTVNIADVISARTRRGCWSASTAASFFPLIERQTVVAVNILDFRTSRRSLTAAAMDGEGQDSASRARPWTLEHPALRCSYRVTRHGRVQAEEIMERAFARES